jgi:hypothetical protein
MGDEHHGGEEPEATAGELARRCCLCRTDIAGEFFVLRGLLVCPSCAQGIEQRQTGRGKVRRALLFGAVTAAAAALLWFLATTATGRQLSGFAVVAGIAVGMAVHQGSGGRGGFRYQLTAVLLVYAAFIVRYIPPVFGGIGEAIKKEHAATVLAEAKEQVPAPARPTAGPAATEAAPAAAAPATGTTGNQTSTIATLKAYFVFTVVAWCLVLGSPFMPGTAGTLSLLSLAAGVVLAWYLNRRVRLRGPFSAVG